MQVNAYVVDDHGKPVPDYFLEFFSNPEEAQDPANVYLHANVIEDVKKNSQNEALRNLYFDRTDLVEGYYPRFSAGANPVLYMSISAAAPGAKIHYFDPDNRVRPAWCGCTWRATGRSAGCATTARISCRSSFRAGRSRTSSGLRSSRDAGTAPARVKRAAGSIARRPRSVRHSDLAHHGNSLPS